VDFWPIISIVILWLFFIFDFLTTLSFSSRYKIYGLLLLFVKTIPLVIVSIYMSTRVAWN
jgi:hypothetical protein